MNQTDAEIPLMYRPPQVENPLQVMGQVQSLRNMAQQGQALGLENQQRQMQMQSQQAMRQAYLDSNGDINKVPGLALKNGAQPQDVQALVSHVIEQKKNLAQLDEATVNTKAKVADRLAGMGQAAINAKDPISTQSAWDAFRQEAAKHADPNDPQFAQLYPAQYPGADDAQMRVNRLKSIQQLSTEAHQTIIATNAQDTAKARLLSAQAVKEGQDQTTHDKAVGDTAKYLSGLSAQDYLTALPHVQGSNPTVGAAFTPDMAGNAQRILRVGMTPAQVQAAQHQDTAEQHAQDTAAETARHNQADEGIAQDRLDFKKTQQAKTQTASDKADQAVVGKAMRDESRLNMARTKLGQALSGGKFYLEADVNGNLKPQKPIAGDDETKADQMRDMQASYDRLSEQLKDTVETKNNAFTRLGVTPKVSTEQAHAAIDAGSQQLQKDIAGKDPNAPAKNQPNADITEVTKPKPQPVPSPALPQAAIATLKEGIDTKFDNGQTWTIKNGKPVQVQAPGQ